MFKIAFDINSNMNRQRRLCCTTSRNKSADRFKLPPDNSKTLAKIWPDFVDMDKRMKKEIPFILDRIHKTDLKVFDSTLGSGATSIGLKLFGVKFVVSNEIDTEMVLVALHQASRKFVNLEIISYNWLAGFPSLMSGRFDAVTCLGNSLTCVLNPAEHVRILRNFRKLLNANGILIIDERNYPRIMDGGFHHSGEYVYCGTDRVACRPLEISDDMIVMEYKDIRTDEKAYLELYPFEKGEMLEILKEAGFHDVRVYGDYKNKFSYDDAEFITYVARK